MNSILLAEVPADLAVQASKNTVVKVCKTCKKEKAVCDFTWTYNKKRHYGMYLAHCKECLRNKNKEELLDKNSEKYKSYINRRNNYKLSGKRSEITKRHHSKKRTALLSIYGGRCECCGEDNPKFLTLEHKNGDGGLERRTVNKISILNNAIKKPNYDKYTILCYNCNCSKSQNKVCCHAEFSLKSFCAGA